MRSPSLLSAAVAVVLLVSACGRFGGSGAVEPLGENEKAEPPGAAEGAPVPNRLPTASSSLEITKNGAAVGLRGTAANGALVFAQNCVSCHGVEGQGGVANAGSDDGTVPPLHPIDPGFMEDAKGDSAAFIRGIDLFIQHGSQPPGPNPTLYMIPWGDQILLTQQQIADVEAYLLQLNGGA